VGAEEAGAKPNDESVATGLAVCYRINQRGLRGAREKGRCNDSRMFVGAAR